MRVAARINADQSKGDKCLVVVSVHLAGLKENMTINVVVDRDADGVQEAAIARAKDFARQFATQPS
jgi:hypothetical protein